MRKEENVILAWWLVTYVGGECAAKRLSETNITARNAWTANVLQRRAGQIEVWEVRLVVADRDELI